MADKITIFKEVFDYYYYGEITKEQLADLLLMHYETRWGNGVDINDIEDKDLRMIWRTLQHSVIKSAKNAKQYEKQQNKKSTFQNTVGTEFDIQKPEIKNKPILIPQITQDDNQYQPEVESGLNSLKMGKNNEFEIEDNIDETNNRKNSENMGQCLGTLEELKAKNQDVEVIMQKWLEDDDNAKMYNRYLNALVQYKFNQTPENEEMAQGADRKLMELCKILNIQNKKEYLDYVKEDLDYKVAIVEKSQRVA